MMLSDVCQSDVCQSAEYIRPKLRTKKPRKTKIGTDVAHVTRDLYTTFQVKFQRSRSPGRFGCLFKSLHNLDGWHHNLRHCRERAAACRPWGGGTVWQPAAYSLFIFECFTCNFLMDVFHYNLNLLNIIRDCIFLLHFMYINLKDISCISTNLFIKQTQLFSSHTV